MTQSARREITLRYGRTGLKVNLPADVAVLHGHMPAAALDPWQALRAAVAAPIGTPPLAAIVRARPPRSVAITISDITRPVPNEVILTVLLETLNAAGVRDEQVTVVIGTGMHRPSTPEERRILLGSILARPVTVLDHQPDHPAELVQVCDDPPVRLNRHFAQASLKIVTGLIEPHFMAGFSGGRKGVCPALVDLETIQRFHGYAAMAHPHSVEGRMEGNPCHEEGLRVARRVGVDFLVNVAIDDERRLVAAWAGELEQAHQAGCRLVSDWTTAKVDRGYDLVVTSAGGYPLDQNFYQSVKGMVTALPALDGDAHLLIVSACQEIGSPEYVRTMARYHDDWRRFLRDAAQQSRAVKDQWQFQMQARVLERIGAGHLHFVTDGLGEKVLEGLHVAAVSGGGAAAERTQRFIEQFVQDHPGASVAVIPQGPYTMLRRG